jgi:hypothetical protein
VRAVAGDGDDLLGVERVEPDVDGCGHGAMTPPRRVTHHPVPPPAIASRELFPPDDALL